MSYLVTPHNSDQENITANECGFNPFYDERSTFDVRFYLVAIVFLVFDLEVSFLLLWSLVLGQISLLRFWSMKCFNYKNYWFYLRMV